MPRGVALVIGCNTFPTWNAYPGIFASLVTGNAVVVKPHPRAVLPLAISVEIARVGARGGRLRPGARAARRRGRRPGPRQDPRRARRGRDHRLHRRPDLRRLARAVGGRARQARLHREGRHQLDRRRLDRRPARDARQPRLQPHALLRPDVHGAAEPLRPRGRRRHRRGAPVLRRVRRPARRGHRPAHRRRRQGRRAARGHGQRPGARPTPTRSPSIADGRRRSRRARLASHHPPGVGRRRRARPGSRRRGRRARGRLHAGVLRPGRLPHPHGVDGAVARAARRHRARARRHDGRRLLDERRRCSTQARDAAAEGGVALSENLTGQVFVNQTAAFSDFHGTGANPAANAAYTDAAFVASRFRVITSRRHV